MRKWYVKKIKARILKDIRAKYQKLEPEQFVMGTLMYNSKCQLNAVQKVREGKAEKVYSCVCIDEDNPGNPILHYINSIKNKKYQDNSWGWLHTTSDYYLIRQITKSEQNEIWKNFSDTRESLIEEHSNGLLRKLLRIKSNESEIV